MVTTHLRAAPRPVSSCPPARLLLPADLLPLEAQELLCQTLLARAARWLKSRETPFWLCGRESAPIWGERGAQPSPTWVLRDLRVGTLAELAWSELERAARVLLFALRPASVPGNELEGMPRRDWHLALQGALRRVGQIYREWRRRRSEAYALKKLRLLLSLLPES